MKKRKKIVKMRGSRDCGAGGIKPGGRGGKGMSGSKKHRKSWIMVHKRDHLGKRGFRPKNKQEVKTINIGDVGKLVGKGKKEIDLTSLGYDKVLGKGIAPKGVGVKARTFSRNAVGKIEKAGGKAEAEFSPEEEVEKPAGEEETKKK